MKWKLNVEMMETNNSGTPTGEQEKSKAPRIRSVAYPSYPVLFCVVLTSKIAREFTDIVYTPREDIAKALKSSGGALLMQLSTCVQYGLLSIKSKEGYKPTELYKKISRPLPEEIVNDFYKECFQKPELYKKLINDLQEKQLPSASGLANILDRKYEVKGNASTLASKVFFKNLEELGLISDNTFSFDGKLEPAEVLGDEEAPNDVETESNQQRNSNNSEPSPKLYLLNPLPPQKIKEDLSGFIEIPIPLKGGLKAKLLMPEDYTDEDIMKVHKVITGYLP